MKISNFDRYGSIKTALKETGFAVIESVKHGKKTVITVTCDQSNKNSKPSKEGKRRKENSCH